MEDRADPAGDIPLNLHEPLFTLAEAAALSGVTEQAFYRWWSRGVLENIGQKDRAGRGGTWLFSMVDVLKLHIMASLTVRANITTASDAADIAGIAAQAALSSTGPDAAASPSRPHVNLLVGWNEDGELVAQTHNISEPGHYLPPRRPDDEKAHPFRRPHIVIPITSLFIDLFLRAHKYLWAGKPLDA